MTAFYRAMPIGSELNKGNYLTKSLKFAVEHAITTSIYNGEDYGVYLFFLRDKDIKEASNVGEYLYNSEETPESYLRGIAIYDEANMNSEFKKVKLKLSKLQDLGSWLEKKGYSSELNILKEAMPRPYGSLFEVDSAEYPSEEFSYDKVTERDLKYMRSEQEGRIRWFGNSDRMIKVDTDYIYPVQGNEFYPDLIKRIEDKIKSSTTENPVNLYCGHADVRVVTLDSIQEDLEYAQYGHGEFSEDQGLTIGDKELDKYLLNKKEYLEDWSSQYDEEEAEELLKDAVENQSGDLGKFIFQVRQGNHRAFAAKNAGEKYIWIDLMANAYNKIKSDEHNIYENYDPIREQLGIINNN